MRAKIILVSVASLLFGVGASTLMSGFLFKKEYTRSVDAGMLAVATGLKQELERLVWYGIPVGNLTGFEAECQQTYRSYPDIAYVMVLDPEGKILYHHDPSLHGLNVHELGIREEVRGTTRSIRVYSKSGETYRDALVPVRNFLGNQVAMVRVGFSEELIDRKSRNMILSSMGVAIPCFGLSVVAMILALSVWISTPLNRLLDGIRRVRSKEQDPMGTVEIGSTDEIGTLASEFNSMIRELRETTVSKDLLLESEEKYRNVVEQSIAGVYIIQGRRFRFVNRRFCEIFGYDREALVGKMGPADLVHPDDWEFVNAGVSAPLSGEIRGGEVEFRGIRQDGEVFPVKNYGSMSTFAGRPAIIGTVLDLSREKRLEEQLLHTQKMEAVGRMAGGIAHDINNFLGAITAYCELSKIRAGSHPELERDMDAVIDVSGKAAKLIRQLLAFSKRQPVSPEVVNLNDLLDRMGKMLQSLIGEHIVFRLDPGEELWNVKIDPLQVEQVLVNLVLNARDAIAAAGNITVSTRNERITDSTECRIGKIEPGNHVVLSVTDTGIGIPDDIQGKIFDPFFTTKGMGKGSGLGLATVYGIVLQNGGGISVSSKRGAGTTFEICLPASEGAASATSSRPKYPLPAENHRPLRILLVEDNDDVRGVVGTLLERIGFEVDAVPNAGEAFQRFHRAPERVDILVTDIIMPGESGKALAQRIRNEKQDTKVVFISGYTEEIIDSGDLVDENTRFLQKPFSIGSLVALVNDLAASRLH